MSHTHTQPHKQSYSLSKIKYCQAQVQVQVRSKVRSQVRSRRSKVPGLRPGLTLNLVCHPLTTTQGHSMRIFVKKMVQRCGVWQIKPMTSPDQDPLSTKSNSSGFGSYSQMKFKKGCKNGEKCHGLVWYHTNGMVWYHQETCLWCFLTIPNLTIIFFTNFTAFSKLHLWITPKTQTVWFGGQWGCHGLNLPYSTPLRHFSNKYFHTVPLWIMLWSYDGSRLKSIQRFLELQREL